MFYGIIIITINKFIIIIINIDKLKSRKGETVS